MGWKMLLALGLLLARPCPAAELHFLSFNVAGIPLVQRYASERLDRITRKIYQSRYDVVALQEVWNPFEVGFLRKKAGFPQVWRFGGVPGNGLVTMSRFPASKTAHRTYSVRANPLNFFLKHDGDAVCWKGVFAARLLTPSGGLDVYNTHLIADDTPDQNAEIRVAQILELDRFIRDFSGEQPFVLMGDFNVTTEDPVHELIVDLMGVEDACIRSGRELCNKTFETGRIDYIFGHGLSGEKALDAPVNIEGAPILLSDHNGAVQAGLRLPPLPQHPSPRRREALSKAVKILRDASAQLRRPPRGLPWTRWFLSWWNARQAARLEAVARPAEQELASSAP